MTRSSSPLQPCDRPTNLAALREGLTEVTLRDRARLERRLERCRRLRAPAAREAELALLAREVRRAQEVLAERRLTVPTLTYPQELPVSARREDLLEAIAAHQVIVVAGETGSGKTTQLPKICLEAGRGVRGRIGHTQPRRIAARAVADRIASELDTQLGDAVGYKIRFTDHVNESTLVKLMTDGILLAEIGQDRDLLQYDTLILDEAHERSLNIDFLLGYLVRLLPRRPDLKVIITSATIDPRRFSDHFGGAPVVEVSGRTWPVEVRYRPLEEPADDDGPAVEPRDRIEGICEAVLELTYEGQGDILVFLSGEREIRDTAEALTRLDLRGTEVLPLYGRLSAAEQHRVFTSHRGRRVVLATNVAETSLTVPGIRYVVDPGTARISRYSHRTKVQRLPIEPISQASARQRAGRCGRLSDGVCLRLYSQEDFESRPEFTDPEILRTHLASVILQMTSLGLGEVTDFPFVDPPDRRQIRDGIDLLDELGALRPDEQGSPRRLTEVGRAMARLPVDPRLARMIVQAERDGCVHEVMVIAAALSIQDVRERPTEKQQAADEAHRKFNDPTSDFLTFLNLWNHIETQQRELSGSAFRRLCHQEFLHYLRIREWQDLVAQLRRLARPVAAPQEGAEPAPLRNDAGKGLGLPDPEDRQRQREGHERGGSRVLAARKRRRRREVEVTGSSSPDRIHGALLSGLLSHVGLRDPARRDYQGARGARFAVWPGSALFKKPLAWVMAAELVETSRLWGRVLARVEPEWIEKAAAHLVKRQYSEPHWEKKRGEVVALERVTLYGVPLVVGRRVGYGRIDPGVARELFVRHALVEGDWETHHPFFAENRKILAEIEQWEHRVRRRDLVVDDEELFDFYDRRVPADIVSARHFDAWWKKTRHETPGLLTVTPEVLLREGAVQIREEDFPDVWRCGEVDLPVSYQFEPGTQDDGVTVEVPVSALDLLDAGAFTWQVPGLREELATAMLRSLPKHFRRSFVPAPDHAAAALRNLAGDRGSLPEDLAAELTRMAGVRIPADSWQWDRVPAHLRITFRVVDDTGKVLATGKDLSGLRCRMRPRLRTVLAQATAEIERTGLTAWTIGDLPRSVERRPAGHVLRGYPALVDEGTTVAVRVLDSPAAQETAMRSGTRRLLLLGLPSPVKRIAGSLGTASKLVLSNNPHGGIAPLLADCLDCAADAVVDRAGGPVHSREGFEELLRAGTRRLPATFAEVLAGVEQVLAAWQEVQRRLKGTASPVLLPSLVDLREQAAELVYPGFVTATGLRRMPDLVRYLRAAQRRLEVLPERAVKDRDLMGRVRALSDRYEDFLEDLPPEVPHTGEIAEVRWMLQELRVSLFAQMIRTAYPVSEKRILKELDRLGG
ncbi:MAG: ATP-dependent helicase HrpA [Actinomycetota bacterium]|nr:ATP-dependent helicase HrpA [Actinomycetota bacterium]